jgi:hypothetical protein
MTIRRLYQPDTAALERVVEALYQLLVEPTDDEGAGHKRELAETPESTCVSGEAEG